MRATIKQTRSVCPTCLKSVDAEVYRQDGAVRMRKACDKHGEFISLLASDARHYYESRQGSPAGGSCCGPSGCGTAASNHSCTVLIEICERCNLTCPTCFAGSSPEHSRMMSLAEFRDRVDVLRAGGKQSADMIQLSGGEPTIHPQIFEMLDILFDAGFLNVTIDSNGIRLAQRKFVEAVAERANVNPGVNLYIYLQFDGFEDQTHARLRGRSDLLDRKRRALENCMATGLTVSPVMTLLRGVNDHEVGRFVDLAMEYEAVKHVVIQPAMYSGLYELGRRTDRLTLADAAALLCQQFGTFAAADFGPIPCADPNCHGVAVAVRSEHGLIPVSRYFPQYRSWSDAGARDLVAEFTDTLNGPEGLSAAIRWVLANQDNDSLVSLDDSTVERLLDALTGQDGDLWGRLLTVSIKPFMDAWTNDQDRIDQCCVHILDERGNPVSLCEYNGVLRPRQSARIQQHA
jgi:uncharacterized radical SAM superfamily Fe-S cluster-containing enzyme